MISPPFTPRPPRIPLSFSLPPSPSPLLPLLLTVRPFHGASNLTPSPLQRFLRMQQVPHNPALILLILSLRPPTPLLLMLLPLLLRQVGSYGASDRATDCAQSAATVFVAYETAAGSAEEGGAYVARAGPGTRTGTGTRAVGTSRVASVMMTTAITVTVVVGVGVDVAFVARGGARGVTWRGGVVGGE